MLWLSLAFAAPPAIPTAPAIYALPPVSAAAIPDRPPLPDELVVCLRPEVKLHFGAGKVQTALYPAGKWLPEGSRADGDGP